MYNIDYVITSSMKEKKNPLKFLKFKFLRGSLGNAIFASFPHNYDDAPGNHVNPLRCVSYISSEQSERVRGGNLKMEF